MIKHTGFYVQEFPIAGLSGEQKRRSLLSRYTLKIVDGCTHIHIHSCTRKKSRLVFWLGYEPGLDHSMYCHNKSTVPKLV